MKTLILINWLSFVTITLIIEKTESHGPPLTGPELDRYLSSQKSLDHCLPIISEYIQYRQSTWSIDQIPESQQISFDPFALSTSYHQLHPPNIRNQTCVLSPVVTPGPYHHFSRHPIRQNLAEWQEGLLFMIDIGVIDVETCEPIPNALVDIWHANATGFYSGHPVRSPEFMDELPQVGGKRAGLLTAYPLTREDETFLRAAWPTNSNGVSRFTSIFPGYYTGRATHVHAKVHLNWTEHQNTTSTTFFTSTESQYIGQFFFPDEINLQIDRMSPYRFNPLKDRTRNWRDSGSIFDESFQNGFDPIFEIKKFGNILNQGLVGFMTVGIDRRATVGEARIG
ncbi:uncharacterized protein MELLADRAFT_70973 [Melampsora larici-populina 98AG31]|uniref:Intradiol ring-cleavage dioxygenases domain-containing protein n=1 Tax=Melampsora larici-populina (strain 98AG31 / pathotype 3-4-7) TaxID=747676 RepID=F4RAI0_MELLP|nr:uncharacterized protein MELLADRAFT_70973 [Melampsora larici-populina 98AG31]EGG10482.1 hypothetical protein MELLADRAFT_70973 [Melampsora larici-populina 98AG31]